METDINSISYENHYRLLEHYSKLIFRTRISILSLIIVVVAFIIKIFLDYDCSFKPIQQVSCELLVSILFITTALFLNFLYFMEIGYTRRFYHIVATLKSFGKHIQNHPSAFNGELFKSEAWPIHLIYGVVILLFSALAIKLSWSYSIPIPLLLFIGMMPFVLFITAWIKFRTIQSQFL